MRGSFSQIFSRLAHIHPEIAGGANMPPHTIVHLRHPIFFRVKWCKQWLNHENLTDASSNREIFNFAKNGKILMPTCFFFLAWMVKPARLNFVPMQ